MWQVPQSAEGACGWLGSKADPGRTMMLRPLYRAEVSLFTVLLPGLSASWQVAHCAVATPVWTTPQFTPSVLLGVGLPLFIVTMASQNVPGVAVMHTAGYRAPISSLMTGTGVINLLLAPFGCFALNLAAITAALCMSKEAHEDPSRRYLASVAAGSFYLVLGVFGAAVGALFAAFPKELVLAIAGLALFGTIAGGLTTAMREEKEREPALITFLITASGISLFGVGSAFWGLIGGAIALMAFAWRKA